MTEKKTRGHDRTRVWSAIVYPESAPTNWRDVLEDEHIEWAESPLHEFDVNPTGEVKKAHWHIVLCFEGPKSFEQVLQLLEPLNCPRPQRCHALKGAVRYFVHMDNPEKYQYNRSDIVGHGGFDVDAALAPSSSERYTLIGEMMDFVNDNDIIEMQDLYDYARANRFHDWHPLLCDSATVVMSKFVASRRHRSERAQKRSIVPEES